MTSPKTSLAALLAIAFAMGGAAVAAPANAAGLASGPWTDTSSTSRGAHDVFTDGARGIGERDSFTDGARGADKRDAFTDGAHGTDSRDPYTHGG